MIKEEITIGVPNPHQGDIGKDSVVTNFKTGRDLPCVLLPAVKYTGNGVIKFSSLKIRANLS